MVYNHGPKYFPIFGGSHNGKIKKSTNLLIHNYNGCIWYLVRKNCSKYALIFNLVLLLFPVSFYAIICNSYYKDLATRIQKSDSQKYACTHPSQNIDTSFWEWSLFGEFSVDDINSLIIMILLNILIIYLDRNCSARETYERDVAHDMLKSIYYKNDDTNPTLIRIVKAYRHIKKYKKEITDYYNNLEFDCKYQHRDEKFKKLCDLKFKDEKNNVKYDQKKFKQFLNMDPIELIPVKSEDYTVRLPEASSVLEFDKTDKYGLKYTVHYLSSNMSPLFQNVDLFLGKTRNIYKKVHFYKNLYIQYLFIASFIIEKDKNVDLKKLNYHTIGYSIYPVTNKIYGNKDNLVQAIHPCLIIFFLIIMFLVINEIDIHDNNIFMKTLRNNNVPWHVYYMSMLLIFLIKNILSLYLFLLYVDIQHYILKGKIPIIIFMSSLVLVQLFSFMCLLSKCVKSIIMKIIVIMTCIFISLGSNVLTYNVHIDLSYSYMIIMSFNPFSAWLNFIYVLYDNFFVASVWYHRYFSLKSVIGFLKMKKFFLDNYKIIMKKIFVKSNSNDFRHLLSSNQSESSNQNEIEGNDENVIIDVRNVYYWFDKEEKILNNVTIKLYNNNITCLIGENGSGKSTLMKIILKMIKPKKGSIKFFLDDDSSIGVSSVGYCSQKSLILENLTVEDHFILYSKFFGLHDKQNYLNKIKEIGLEAKTKELATTMSGGMKRSLCVALAFYGNKRFVILDEPTAGVDEASRINIWNFIRTQKEKYNFSVLFSTHFEDEAERQSDNIVVMKNGSIQSNASLNELKTKYSPFFVLKFKLSKISNKNINDVFNHLKSKIFSIELVEQLGNEIQIHVHHDMKHLLTSILKNYNTLAEKFHIIDFSIQDSGIFEILTNLKHLNKKKQKECDNTYHPANNNCCQLLMLQFQAVMLEKYKALKNSFIVPLTYILCPAILICILITFSNCNGDMFRQKVRVSRFLSMYQRSPTTFFSTDESNFESTKDSFVRNLMNSVWKYPFLGTECSELKNMKNMYD
ncbi:hypothetical protein A3Q56_01407 [Intoshia linei]|uniref:ABC transporter domain-containing protein n=1 Tax=Intoshia linei TaxID=1819745 RepID=A0A177B933_9BILA|nr:hypothetical protein A3Q56_01407 [Intoshia linei]